MAEHEKSHSKEMDDRYGGKISRVKKQVPKISKSIIIKGPTQLLRELAEDISDLNAQKGISDRRDSKLQAVLKACDDLDANDDVAVVESLKRFINSVKAKQAENDEYLQEDAQDLTDAAHEIIDLLVLPEKQKLE